MLSPRIIGCSLAIVFLLGSNLRTEAAGGLSNPTGDWYRYYSRGYDESTNHLALDITGFSKEKAYSIENQPVMAAKDGKVIKADWQAYKKDEKGNLIKDKNGNPIPDTEKGWGKVVIIDHGDGIITVYGHLADFNVKEGDIVNQGDIIGKIDST